MNQDEYKVILVGDMSVGKSSVAIRQCKNMFPGEIQPTIGSSQLYTKIPIEDKVIHMIIWDTAGQEEYNSLIPMYTRNSDCAIIVCSAVNQQSIDNIQKWHRILEESTESPEIIIAVNKIDLLEDQINGMNEIRAKLSKKYQNIFFVSAKTGYSISELFVAAAEKCYASKNYMMNALQQPPKRGGCC